MTYEKSVFGVVAGGLDATGGGIRKTSSSKGYKLDPENPHFLIRTYHTKEQKKKLKTMHSAEVEFRKGSMAIEFVDAKSGEVIYKGEAEIYLHDESDPDRIKKDFYESVENLLKDFAPAVQK